VKSEKQKIGKVIVGNKRVARKIDLLKHLQQFSTPISTPVTDNSVQPQILAGSPAIYLCRFISIELCAVKATRHWRATLKPWPEFVKGLFGSVENNLSMLLVLCPK